MKTNSQTLGIEKNKNTDKKRIQKEKEKIRYGYELGSDRAFHLINFQEPIFKGLSKENSKRKYYYHEKLRF